MDSSEHPSTRIRLLAWQLRELEPENPLLRFELFVLGEQRWTPEGSQEYHALFNPNNNRTMPEVDDVYCAALTAAIKRKKGKLNGSA